MSVPQEQTQMQATEVAKPNKEDSVVQIRQLLEKERSARIAAEARAAELEKTKAHRDDDDDDSDEPYVDQKRLNKKLSSFEKQMDAKIEQKAEQKAHAMLSKEKEAQWLRNNNDFYEVMSHAQTLAERDPELAETILSMPEGFERQKLVYKNIKAMGLHKKADPAPSVQDKIDANRRSPFYQPTGVGAAPYAAAGDFSPSGQKNAYAKMQELKNKLRI